MVGRNAPCPCGSGLKYKQCCLGKEADADRHREDPRIDSPLRRRARGGHRGDPVATVVFYGPDDRRATKVTVGIVPRRGVGPDTLRRWFCERGDIRFDLAVEKEILAFIAEHGALTVTMADAILGCPHEEGVDYPAGEACPECPFWAGRDRWAPLRTGPVELVADEPDVGDGPRCGLCGNTEKLTRTKCCGNWICDDEDEYELFSYARNSCYRNHQRFTLCGSHHVEGHEGRWQDCPSCREGIDKTESYVYLGTNEYNFEVLRDPPDFEPTMCASCGKRIVLSEGGYAVNRDRYLCQNCSEREFPWPPKFKGG